jgi:capsular exopolysaccharide synthesis family protein
MLALTLGLLLGAAAALLQESLDDHVRGEDEARRLVSAPVLAHFPELPTKLSTQVHDPAVPDPRVLEGFRVLRTNVQFALVGKPGRTIQVLSSIPSEGKSFTARNLATVMALDGRKVILVDADLHRPSQHRMFGVPQHPGLTHMLVGRATIEECLQETTLPGLSIIPAGDLPPNPAELLNSSVMDEIVARLQTMADVVIFDSPPMLATADGQVLASKVDSIIYVVELGVVPRSGLQRAFELLQQVNARVIGVVFNKVDHGEFPDVYSYYGQYRPFGEAGSGDGANGASGDGSGSSPIITDVKTAAKLLNGGAPNDSWKPGTKTVD